MKKICLILASAALCGSFASTAFATVTINSSTSIAGGNFTPSSKVGMSVTSSSTSYAVTSCHVSGTFEYGSGGGSTYTGDPSKIMSATIPTQTGSVGVPTATTVATGLPTGVTWTAQ